MLVYLPTPSPRHTLFVQPGTEYPVSEWLADNRKARLIPVLFTHGRADVPDNLGRYLIDKGYARPSPLLLPADAGLGAR